MSGCHYCGLVGEPGDLRPYGPGGAPVCHPCATATPERREQTDAAMNVMFDAAEAMSPSGSIVISVADGPQPLVDQIPGGDTAAIFYKPGAS